MPVSAFGGVFLNKRNKEIGMLAYAPKKFHEVIFGEVSHSTEL